MKAWGGSAAAKGSPASRWRPSFRRRERPMLAEGAALRFHLEQFADFLNLEQGSSPHTVEAYRRDIDRLVDYATVKGALSPVDVTSRMLREFVYHLKDIGLASSSIRRN